MKKYLCDIEANKIYLNDKTYVNLHFSIGTLKFNLKLTEKDCFNLIETMTLAKNFTCAEVDFQPLIIKKQLIDNEFLKIRAIEIQATDEEKQHTFGKIEKLC